MDSKVTESFKRDFLVIKGKGWIESHRTHDTGIGKTFEDLIGIVENNNLLADYKDILEIKSTRELGKGMITLFTKSPSHPPRVNSHLRENYGALDPNANNLKTLHTTFSALKFNTFVNKFGFKLEVDDNSEKILLLVKNLQNDKVIDKEIYYTFSDLKKIIENKCKYIAYINAEAKEENGKELFHFKKAVLLTRLTFEKFIKLVKEGIILYDIRIGVYRSGKSKGKTHDHGSGFRIMKHNLNKVFDVEEI